MISIKHTKIRLVNAIFGCFFGILGLILPVLANPNVYADDLDENSETTTSEQRNEYGESTEPTYIDVQSIQTEEKVEEKTKNKIKTCDNSLGSLGWLVCPTTGKIAEAVDWLYEKNRNIIEINPVRADDSSPIYLVWKYFLGVANIAFVIFLLIVIYSQITGVGISSYGVKKALPKLIIAAVLVNLSFFICSLAVDLSNVLGNGLRGVFSAIAENSLPDVMSTYGVDSVDSKLALGDMFLALAGGGSGLALALLALFEGGEIWLLIPAVLGALVAVVIGLITIALRQVVVTLLIMIAPLAIVAYILPNTESLFKKWKNLFTKMLVFYPMYSMLFGASNLAGWAIIASANDGFGVILGTAVQIFPLFFSWSLMKMSGTFLGTINAKVTGFFVRPLATNRAWAESHREFTRQRLLASENVYSPTLRLRQFISDRRVAREDETKENAGTVEKRGRVYAVRQLRNKKGEISREGERAYARQALNMKYDHILRENEADFDEGLGQLKVTQRSHDFRMRNELDKLDYENMHNADLLSASEARADLVKYNNAKSRHERMNAAMNAHMDAVNGYDKIMNENGELVMDPRRDYRFHFKEGSERYRNAISEYNAMSAVMQGDIQDTQFALANATQSYDVQKKIYEGKMQKFFDYTVPTKDLEFRLDELSKDSTALSNIDAIIAGMRVLNQRGDTDLVKRQLDQILEHGVELGTRASQSIASFLMFEVKDNDPFLRRFGKYINLETARMFNSNDRKLATVDYDEYIKGYHVEPNGEVMFAKKGMKQLTEGTSLDAIERTAFGSFDESLMKAYGYRKGKGGNWDVEGYLKKKDEITTAIEPAFLSAMQKWTSGSEQITSGVKGWFGYEIKMKKGPDGKVIYRQDGPNNKVPETELVPVWDNEAFEGHEKEVEDFYHRKATSFVEDQTVNQVQNMRTDVREAMNKFLEKDFYGDPDFDPEGYAKRVAQVERDRQAIFSKDYPGVTEEEQEELRKKAWKKYYYTNVVGVPYRDLLYRTGKLEQMVKTSHSGGGNAMKDWNRMMAGLDDDTASDLIRMHKQEELKEKEEKEKKEKKEKGASPDSNGPESSSPHSRVKEILDEYARLRERMDAGEIPEGAFYDEAMKFLNGNFGNGSHIIKEKFKDHRRLYPKENNYDLFRELREILMDEGNYL